MVLSAKCSISAGEPLALSYFEGSNDEFLMHYGFVPPSNPHDTVMLYTNLATGLEAAWWADIGSKVGKKFLGCSYSLAMLPIYIGKYVVATQ